MNRNHAFFLAALALPFAVATAHAADPVDSWRHVVEAQIERSMSTPADGSVGSAMVTFHRSPSGQAVDIAANGGSAAIRRAAVLTAQGLHDLPPLPNGMEPGARVQMRLLFGDLGGEARFARQDAAMRQAASVRNTQVAARLNDSQVAMVTGPR